MTGEATTSAAGTIAVEIPARLKLLVASITGLLDAVSQRADQLARDGKADDCASIERLYAELSASIETTAHQCTLAAAAASEPQRVEIGGKVLTRVGEVLGTYKTMTGPAMNYAGAIKKGLPIGSDNVEATCKTLAGLRMKRSGSRRWHRDTGTTYCTCGRSRSATVGTTPWTISATQRTSVRRV